MLFNSYGFIFLFLPITLFGFIVIARKGHHALSLIWLICASLFFYGWSNPIYLPLLCACISFNYIIGAKIRKSANPRIKQFLLILGIALNIGLLGYFKYANFFVDNLNSVFGSSINFDRIIFPLGISFYTFLQIAYLVDVYRGLGQSVSFLNYALFVSFFPQLFAGPIVLQNETLPQFSKEKIKKPSYSNFSIGFTNFIIGLFKKVVFADGIATYSSFAFEAALSKTAVSFFEAWGGALAYSFQLYFDFSGYSDMAIGVARIFGIKLPLNFNSPYKSKNIIEFWRQWHMTLSRFLKNYLYIPLGGNRKGPFRRNVNLMITMLIGGLWHGAGWTFVVWGLLHGAFLMINHFWRALCDKLCLFGGRKYFWTSIFGQIITFLAVVVAWVFFRAENFYCAMNILKGMFLLNGVSLPSAIGYSIGPVKPLLEEMGVTFSLGGGAQFVATYLWVFSSALIVFAAPNTQQLMRNFHPAYDWRKHASPYGLLLEKALWRPSIAHSLIIGGATVISLLGLTRVSQFLYFQF